MIGLWLLLPSALLVLSVLTPNEKLGFAAVCVDEHWGQDGAQDVDNP